MKDKNITDALHNLSPDELGDFLKYYEEHQNDNSEKNGTQSSDQQLNATAGAGTGIGTEALSPETIKQVLKSLSGQNNEINQNLATTTGGADVAGNTARTSNWTNGTDMNFKNVLDSLKEKDEGKGMGMGMEQNKMNTGNTTNQNAQNVQNAQTSQGTGGQLGTETAGTNKGGLSSKIEELLKQWHIPDIGINNNAKDGNQSHILDQITSMLHQIQNSKNSRAGGGTVTGTGATTGDGKKNNKQWLSNFEHLLNQFIHMNDQKKKGFQLDKTINQPPLSTKGSLLMESEGYTGNYYHERSNKDGSGVGIGVGTGSEGWGHVNSGIANENNEKLKSYFGSLGKSYHPYSYERKILNELSQDEDIKRKYNLSEEFERKILEHFEKGDMNTDSDEDYEERSEVQEEEKRKIEEAFEDINEQDDNDSIEQGSISNRLLRKSQMGKNLLFKNMFDTSDTSLNECNCGNKVKNCLLYFMDLSNMEYILQSLEINVKGLVDKYTEALVERQEFLKGKKERRSESFLLPLPPVGKHSNAKDISSYVLRVPKVLFLTTRKSFTSSFDRYFYHLYNIMESQLKWKTFLWGYGFKYYPIIYPKNLHALLHTHVHQLGKQPFDLVFVHESFVSNYYNHYFFTKNMPKITTLLYITDGWDSTVKKKFLSLFPSIMFQNQVNIFEFNPLSSLNIEQEKTKLSNSLWNKVSNAGIHDVITNKHKKKSEPFGLFEDSNKTQGTNALNTEIENTLWAYLPHGVNHCCATHYDRQFEILEGNEDGAVNGVITNTHSEEAYHHQNPYMDDEEEEEDETENQDAGYAYNGKKNENTALINHNKKYESTYILLDLFLQNCAYMNEVSFNDETRDIDVLFIYNTSTKSNDFIVQKIMDNIYNKHMNQFKTPIKKYVVDTYFWKIWGLQTTHQLIKNKIYEYNNMLHRSKVCVISSKFAGTLNRMVIDALFNGCVVITDKSHNKNLNKYLAPVQIPFEYYEITDLIYNKQNLETLSRDLIALIKKTLNEVNSGERNALRIEAYKTILSTYTYTGIVLNWIIPTFYFYLNREKYELTNNYFVLPHYFEKIITKSLKATSAKREKIIANIDISLQEDFIMNNNEVFVWGLIWVFIFSIILLYILRNSSFLEWFFTRRKEAYR